MLGTVPTTTTQQAVGEPGLQPLQMLPVIPRNHISNCQDKFRAALSQKNHQQKLQALAEDIQALNREHDHAVAELAKKHCKKVQYICQLVNHWINYKKEQKLSLWNGLIHLKAKELNEGLPAGQHTSLANIWKALVTDKNLKPENLMRQQQKDIVASL
ncbi:hypothetical protein P691DRAFT_767779 [Macrolepiota fuliginosa MF-IS2]|uniref:Uncharacterized protein n=1 Tax=Macrolepiota fuliginosa MF-IS2 TaxID=1400762 RepID=A0A9P5WZ65_9AGAR|nr:hypothetical protein P691DRAFT_767779 [Macrolepiota fuliginosa MF-IS2]